MRQRHLAPSGLALARIITSHPLDPPLCKPGSALNVYSYLHQSTCRTVDSWTLLTRIMITCNIYVSFPQIESTPSVQRSTTVCMPAHGCGCADQTQVIVLWCGSKYSRLGKYFDCIDGAIDCQVKVLSLIMCTLTGSHAGCWPR